MSAQKILCIISDLDGTLAHIKDRGIYEWEKVMQDLPNPNVIDILRAYKRVNGVVTHYSQVVPIIILTGRNEACRTDTEIWLAKNAVPYNKLYMRPREDRRADVVLKKELYQTYIEPYYHPLFILEDRSRVVSMWRNLGLTCLQVAEGDF